jgi:hypothetical protein
MGGGAGVFLLLAFKGVESGVQVAVGAQPVQGESLPIKCITGVPGAGITISDRGKEIGRLPVIAPVQSVPGCAIERICWIALQPRRPEIGNC